MLQNTVGGGKPKMKFHFAKDKKEWPIQTKPYQASPKDENNQQQLIDRLQEQKIIAYQEIIQHFASPRDGVIQLMDAALQHPLVKACCF
jgi:hypothetical protein